MMDVRIAELEWLAKQTHPVWGGHLARGEPLNPVLQTYLDDGLIEAVDDAFGYRITKKGRELLQQGNGV